MFHHHDWHWLLLHFLLLSWKLIQTPTSCLHLSWNLQLNDKQWSEWLSSCTGCQHWNFPWYQTCNLVLKNKVKRSDKDDVRINSWNTTLISDGKPNLMWEKLGHPELLSGEVQCNVKADGLLKECVCLRKRSAIRFAVHGKVVNMKILAFSVWTTTSWSPLSFLPEVVLVL